MRAPRAGPRRRGRARTDARPRAERRPAGTPSRRRAAAAADSGTTTGTRACRRGSAPRARGAPGRRRARGGSTLGESGRRNSRLVCVLRSAICRLPSRVCGYSRTVPPEATSTAPSVSCQALRKVYAGVEPVVALDGFDLDVAPGESVALVGESGTGKSTLLHLVGGIDRPTSG